MQKSNDRAGILSDSKQWAIASLNEAFWIGSHKDRSWSDAYESESWIYYANEEQGFSSQRD